MSTKPPGDISQDLKTSALFYHRQPRPGKLEIQPTKPLGNQRDLALAYSPGVAAASEAIAAEPSEAANLTSRQNLVAVITNGTAVLGLGDIGPLASKPVMASRSHPASDVRSQAIWLVALRARGFHLSPRLPPSPCSRR